MNGDAEWGSSRILLMNSSGSHVRGPDCVSLKWLRHHQGMLSGRATGSNMCIIKRMEWVLECGEGQPGQEGQRANRRPLQDALWKPGKLYVGKHGAGMLECHFQTRGNRPCLPVGSKDGDGETAKDGPLR